MTVDDHSIRSPVLDNVWEDVDIHKRGPVLAGANLSQFTIGVTQAKSRLACVWSCPEELPLKKCLQFSEASRNGCLRTKAGRSDAREKLAVGSEIAIERRQHGWPYYVEPVGIICFEVVAHTEHDKAIYFHTPLQIRRLSRLWCTLFRDSLDTRIGRLR